MYYVVQVATGQEDKMVEDIKKYNSNNNANFDVFTPSRKVLRKYKGVYVEYVERCFPGYVFVETDDAKQLFYDLYQIPGFTKLLGREGYSYHFTPLDKDEERMVNILYGRAHGRSTEISDIEILEGDVVRILRGPLTDIEGTVVKYNLHKRKATIEISLFQRKVTCQVGINIITKVS